jgi:hypothetical protein
LHQIKPAFVFCCAATGCHNQAHRSLNLLRGAQHVQPQAREFWLVDLYLLNTPVADGESGMQAAAKHIRDPTNWSRGSAEYGALA